MVMHVPTKDHPRPSPFSLELTRAIAGALRDYLLTDGAGAEATLRALTNRVCAEAKVLGLPPEKMLIAIKQLFERISLPDLPLSDRRSQAFQTFVSGCIESYFHADAHS